MKNKITVKKICIEGYGNKIIVTLPLPVAFFILLRCVWWGVLHRAVSATSSLLGNTMQCNFYWQNDIVLSHLFLSLHRKAYFIDYFERLACESKLFYCIEPAISSSITKKKKIAVKCLLYHFLYQVPLWITPFSLASEKICYRQMMSV